jgi:Fe2+ transport system protein B
LEITDRVVVCLNLMDEARRRKLDVDHRLLARRLGVPVVPTAARQREGLPELTATLAEVATGKTVGRPRRVHAESPELKQAISTLKKEIQQLYPNLPNAGWVAMRLLDGDERIAEALRSGELGDLTYAEPTVSTESQELTLEPA